jgi:hypothetical protein
VEVVAVMTADETTIPFALAARDGCACPPWVVRCVHFGGSVCLWIWSQSLWLQHNPGKTFNDPADWTVCKADLQLDVHPVQLWIYEGDDEDAALAAFYAAEERLLAEASQ